MHAGAGTPATVAEEQAGDAVDDAYRKTKQAEVSAATAARISEQLVKARPTLANHFQQELAGMQKPQLLLYREGDFFRAHPDSSDQPGAADYVRQRRVSAVVFLNGATPDEPAGYSGGSLVFYGLMGERSGKTVGLPLDGETGMLIGFPSDLVHAVLPVTVGERYTIVTWFY
jgi:predicted 2-oxoglutarate/Fe(II)-dependent dioxygenase YbiX